MDELPRDEMMLLGAIHQKVDDLREWQPRQDESIARNGDRLSNLERQFAARHRENTDRMAVLQVTLDKLSHGIEAIEARLTAVEKPTAATADRRLRRRTWIMRAVQLVASVGAAAMIVVEPASKAAVEFFTRRYLDR